MKRVLIALSLLMFAQAPALAAPPDLPKPKLTPEQQALMDSIRQRQGQLLNQALPEASASKGQYLLESGNFDALLEGEPLTQAQLWNSASGRYSQPVDLQFSTARLESEGSSLGNEELNALDQQLEAWQQVLERGPEMDATTRDQLESYYQGIRQALRGESIDEEVSDNFVHIAYIQPEGAAKPRPVAVALTSFDSEENIASLERIAANPYSQISRAARPQNSVGHVGEPLMDYSLRHLAELDDVESIGLSAASERVAQFAHSKGFVRVCD